MNIFHRILNYSNIAISLRYLRREESTRAALYFGSPLPRTCAVSSEPNRHGGQMQFNLCELACVLYRQKKGQAGMKKTSEKVAWAKQGRSRKSLPGQGMARSI
jgi:hypothetical protein